MKRPAKPSHKLRLAPRYIGPCLPVRGEFTRFDWPTPLDLWPTRTLELCCLHGCEYDHKTACATELTRHGA